MSSSLAWDSPHRQVGVIIAPGVRCGSFLKCDIHRLWMDLALWDHDSAFNLRDAEMPAKMREVKRADRA